MNDILMGLHFHKPFPFNFNSSWIKATYAGEKAPYGWHPPTDDEYINTTRQLSIHEYAHHYSRVSESEFLKAMGVLATEYYLWKYGKADYIGAGSYRRYLLLDDTMPQTAPKVIMAANQTTADYLSSEAMKDTALKLLEKHDLITNLPITLSGKDIESQYLESQPYEYWNLFIQGIMELFPDYRNKIDWFKGNTINFETSYIMRKQMFKKYISEFFELLEYIWTHTDKTYPIEPTTSEPFPWRYPGFLGERFFPFFVYANGLNPAYVPLVLVE